MMNTFGFIGTGNMGSALAKAAVKSGRVNILLSNRTAAKAEALSDELKFLIPEGADCSVKVVSNSEAALADYVFIGVKPQMYPELIKEIGQVLDLRTDRFVLVSMMAGYTVQRLLSFTEKHIPVIRLLPNTPVAIGQGMTLYCSKSAEDEEVNEFLNIMSKAGRFSKIPEDLIDAASSVTGCGPAFADLFIQSLADGAVACGVPRALALEYSEQMLIGSAALALESGKHPGKLCDEVCSPGGSTIQGVIALENGGFRAAVISAVIAAYEKNRSL